MKLSQLAINTLRLNGVGAVNAANSGHPGIVLGAAPIVHALFADHLVFDITNPRWINRDRFILSAGHGSALLYAMLQLLDLISLADLKAFRSLNSKTPGHPEYGHTPGVEATTGPLGQGIAMAVGIAIAEAHLHARFNELAHFTYVLCGDGDLQEGVAMEAMSLAGRLQLNKLIILHDSNDVQLDTAVAATFNENLAQRMSAIGFNYQRVDGQDELAISAAIAQAKASLLPSFIEVKTIIGYGASKQGTSAVHGAPLGTDLAQVKTFYQWVGDEFTCPAGVREYYQEQLKSRLNKALKSFKVSTALAAFLAPLQPLRLDQQALAILPNQATRVSSGQVINFLSTKYQQWLGGSADLASSTKAAGADGAFSAANRLGRNILFGVREFAMAAIANGLALHSNLRPFVSTFLVFSDYLKPALRLSALMQLPVTYIFTHDSFVVGEDGPTHQPIEQLAMLRAVPNFHLLRPADTKEVLGAYEYAFNSAKPTAIVLTRQNLPELDTTNQQAIAQGVYYLRQTKNTAWTLVASGSELANALLVAKELDLNLVSMSHFYGEPTWDKTRAIAIEAASSFGLSYYAFYTVALSEFGTSAPGEVLYEHFGFDLASLTAKVKLIIERDALRKPHE